MKVNALLIHTKKSFSSNECAEKRVRRSCRCSAYSLVSTTFREGRMTIEKSARSRPPGPYLLVRNINARALRVRGREAIRTRSKGQDRGGEASCSLFSSGLFVYLLYFFRLR